MASDRIIDAQKDAALFAHVVEATIPLLANGPRVLGTGTLFTHENRFFLVTAAHILKTDAYDPASDDIDLAGVAVPNGRSHATIYTLGSFTLHRPAPPSKIDVVVLELHDAERIEMLQRGWRFLGFDAVAPFRHDARFILSGFPQEGIKWDGKNVGQNFLMLATDQLDRVPALDDLEPAVDLFFQLDVQGELLDGSMRDIPKLNGMSGASLWAYSEPAGFW